MANNVANPHDKIFRSTMTDPKAIREFFEEYLPTNIRAAINFDLISPEKESFIDDRLRLQIADLLYSAEFNGKQGYLYLLIEHQSTPCELMPFRILKYMIAITDHHLAKTGEKTLPVIYPMIFYSGQRNYKYSTDIFDLFGNEKELAQSILWKPYQLIDLSKISDEKLKANVRHGIVAYTMKHIYGKNIALVLKNILKCLNPVANQEGMEYHLQQILSYIIDTSEIDKQEFTTIVKTSLPTIGEEKIMTLADQFRQEGKQEGLKLADQFRQEGLKLAEQFRQKGVQEGKLEGKTEAFKTIAINLFSRGMAVDQIAAITGLSIKDIEQLKNESTN